MRIHRRGHRGFRRGRVNRIALNLGIRTIRQNDSGEGEYQPFFKTLKLAKKTCIFELARSHRGHDGRGNVRIYASVDDGVEKIARLQSQSVGYR